MSNHSSCDGSEGLWIQSKSLQTSHLVVHEVVIIPKPTFSRFPQLDMEGTDC